MRRRELIASDVDQLVGDMKFLRRPRIEVVYVVVILVLADDVFGDDLDG